MNKLGTEFGFIFFNDFFPYLALFDSSVNIEVRAWIHISSKVLDCILISSKIVWENMMVYFIIII